MIRHNTAALLSATLITFGSFVSGVEGAITVYFHQVGDDVQAEFSGSLSVESGIGWENFSWASSTSTLQHSNGGFWEHLILIEDGPITQTGTRISHLNDFGSASGSDITATIPLNWINTTWNPIGYVGSIDQLYYVIDENVGSGFFWIGGDYGVGDTIPVDGYLYWSNSLLSDVLGTFSGTQTIMEMGTNPDNRIDYTTVPVPEPSSAVLLLCGVLGLAFRRSRC